MNPLNPGITVTLGGTERRLVFDMNTYGAFEEAAGRFVFDALADMYAAFAEAQAAEGKADFLRVARRVSIRDLQSLIWAAMHDYDANDNPVWPLTRNQVGRLITVENMADLLVQVLTGQSDAMPEQRDEQDRPTQASA
jgi:hypothetical protein